MIKVCHMTSAHQPGDTRIFQKECVSLAKAGYQVFLVQRGESGENSGVRIIGVGQPSGGRLTRMTSFARKVYEAALAVDADLYHLHDPELLPYGIKLKRRGKKVIFDSHELYDVQLRQKPYLPGWCTRIIAFGYARYERYVLRRLDGAIFPCTVNGEDPFAGRCPHTALVDNSVKLEDFYERYDPEAVRNQDQICLTGSLTEARGITSAIRAAASAKCTLALAGPISPADYEAQLRKMPEFSSVDYRGVLAKDQVAALLQTSRVGLSPLLNQGQYWKAENLATKICEYLAMGLPVVMNGSAYNRAFVERWHCGICVDSENVEEIASAIRYLLDHPEEARQMGENGRQAVREEFNWGVEEKKLLALYEEIFKE